MLIFTLIMFMFAAKTHSMFIVVIFRIQLFVMNLPNLFSVNGTEEEMENSANCLWLVTNSKPCSSCKSPIQKNEGCNHIKCSKVGFSLMLKLLCCEMTLLGLLTMLIIVTKYRY